MRWYWVTALRRQPRPAGWSPDILAVWVGPCETAACQLITQRSQVRILPPLPRKTAPEIYSGAVFMYHSKNGSSLSRTSGAVLFDSTDGILDQLQLANELRGAVRSIDQWA